MGEEVEQGLNPPIDPFAVKTRARGRQEKLIEYLGELLVPQTEGFDHVNLDMTFTYLGNFDLSHVDNLSMAITMSHIYKLKQSEFLLRGMLASFLNSRRSRNAKSMDMFTTMITEQKQSFEDKTEKKEGFSFMGFGKKKK